MKKHNESKINKGIRRSKGKILCKVISFTLIFVMLFCISASAEIETIYVKNVENNEITINVEVDILTNTIGDIYYITKTIVIGSEYILSVEETNIEINISSGNVLKYRIWQYENTVYIDGKYDTAKAAEVGQGNVDSGTIIDNGVTNEVDKPILISMVKSLRGEIYAIEDNIFYNMITVEEAPPVYEGFIGNARGLFDMLFESIQSIFNWLTSPNVIVFFGLGIILTLTTIGILIAKRFFWGR